MTGRGALPNKASGRAASTVTFRSQRSNMPSNKRTELTAPLGAAPGDGDAVRGASCASAHRGPSSSAVLARHKERTQR
jgi:hypothetical protein